MSNLYHCATEYVKQLTIYKRFYPLNIYNLNIFNVGPPGLTSSFFLSTGFSPSRFSLKQKKSLPLSRKGLATSWAHLGLLRHSSSAQASRPVRFSLKQKKSLPLSRKGFPLRGPTWARTRDHLIMSQVL
jgi:hypothetical protein